MKTTHGQEIANRLARIRDESTRIEAIVTSHESDVDDVRHGAAEEIEKLKSENAKLQLTISNLRFDLAKRPEPAAVATGPDYVTQGELVKVVASLGTIDMGEILVALRERRLAP